MDERWRCATAERGKPRVYIQQFLELRLPENDYRSMVKELGHEKPFGEDAATAVMERFVEDLDDGSQFDTVHMERGDGIVVLMTVISFPYRQETLDRLLAEYTAKKMLGTAE